MIPFNIPYKSANELDFIADVINSSAESIDSDYILKCESFLEKKYGFKKVLLTTSCTSALEMSSVLANLDIGDEVIIPSYTYVSTANAFALRGVKIIFADSKTDSPNMDEAVLEKLITPQTKAIVVMHYAGIACNMEVIKKICDKYNLVLIEDAAQCIDSFYKNKPLGSIGDIACFSFHKTKNIHCFEGGFIAINNPDLIKRAEIIREKGTNRMAFDRKEVDKYEWMDIGFSATPSPISSAILYSQLLELSKVQERRKEVWNLYNNNLKYLSETGSIILPVINDFATNNAHIFYFICRNESDRNGLLAHLKSKKVQATFHYLALHDSFYFKNQCKGLELPNAKKFEKCLIRMPLYFGLENEQVNFICSEIETYFKSK